MIEWSEREEQEMIARAKQGDPEANYELSLWALRRSEEEPEEPRWNRLAAKCLVKSAQAGYAPAQKHMNELLASRAAKAAAAAPPAPEPEPEMPEEPAYESQRRPVRLSDVRQNAPQSSARPNAARPRTRQDAPRPADTARRPSSGPRPVPRQERRRQPDYDDGLDGYEENTWDNGYDDEDDRPTRSLFSGLRSPFAQWDDRKWRKMELVCIGVCAVLLIAIGVMLITSRIGGGANTGGASSIPPAMAANPAASPSAPPVEYPDAATMAAIAAADLTIYPSDGEYMTVPTNATVKVGSNSLRLRKGPSTTYSPPLASMPDGTDVAVYATKDDWCLVLYDSPEDGPIYGWCSSEYLIITTGAANGEIG